VPAKEKTTKPSDPAAVDAFMAKLDHPLKVLVEATRQAILASDASIGEEIKWNAPAFFYTGPMAPFGPKEFRRHLVVFNFLRKDSIRLVFLRGDHANDKTGWLEGVHADGRRIATLSGAAELKAHKKTLTAALKSHLKHIGK
jgi:Domain of unknown function (DU1801)